MRVRILKKGKANVDSIREVLGEVAVYCDWPLMEYFLKWFKLRKSEGPNTKIFNLCRSRAYQIVKEPDLRIIGNHWFRHQRLSHLGRYLTPFQLNERIGFWEKLDPAISYVHGTVEEYLEGADKVVS